MTRARLRHRFPLAALAAACLIAVSPRAAVGGEGPQGPAQPGSAKSPVVVEQVENGPAFGVEFKFADINHQNAYLFGGYAGVIFDNTLFVGAAGYWQPDSYYHDYYGQHDYYGYGGYHQVDGYGGVLLEWYALRSPVVSVSLRGLVGGGVATVGGNGYAVYPQDGHHGSSYPPPYGYYGYAYDQGYFVFEPQVNVTLRVTHGVAIVGGGGYRVVAWANGFEDQLQGLTGTFAVRFGGK